MSFESLIEKAVATKLIRQAQNHAMQNNIVLLFCHAMLSR